MSKKLVHGLSFKFAVIFILFTVLIVSCVAVFTYRVQDAVYRQQREEIVRKAGQGFMEQLKNDDEDFLWFLEYIKSGGEMRVEYDSGNLRVRGGFL